MRIINKKYLLVILLIGIILTGFIIFKPKENVKLDNVILKQEVNNKTFAMYTETDNGYEEYEGNKFPDMYVLNIEKSKCIDNNGKELENVLSYENDKVTITSGNTTYCYLYFDKSLGLEIKEKTPNGLKTDKERGAMYRFQGQQSEGINNYICFGTSKKEESGYVDCGLADYDFKNSITMIARLKFNDLESDQQFLGNWEVAGGGLTFYTSVLQIAVYIDDGYKVVDSTHNFSLDMYYTVVSVYDGEEMSIYIDGQKVISQKLSGNIKPSIMPIYLGANPNPDSNTAYSYTTFTDALVFDSALTETEIEKYFSGEINEELVLSEYVNKYADKKSDQELLLYYKFD